MAQRRLLESGSDDSGTPVFTVDEVCEDLKSIVGEFPRIAVRGEVQSLSTSARGHKYFELKGEKAILKVKMWSSVATEFDFSRGDDAIVEGDLDFYPPRGELSLTGWSLAHAGEGAVLARIEATRRKLGAEGLFDEERKQPLPLLPTTIGIVCGADAAVKRDIESAREARFPRYPIIWRESLVTGENAVADLVAAIAELDALSEIEVIVLARGGGSFDDLIPFSDERLCRAIASAATPVVSAIGHAADTPLCDLVADARFATPSRAGMEVIPSREELGDLIDEAMDEADRLVGMRFERSQMRLNAAASQIEAASPLRMVALSREKLLRLEPRSMIIDLLARSGRALDSSRLQLDALSPQAVLNRGYSVVRTAGGALVTNPAQAPAGTELDLRMARGVLSAISQGEHELGKE